MNDNWINQIPYNKYKKYSQTGEEGYLKFKTENSIYELFKL